MPKVYDWVHGAGIADELTSDERIFLELLPASIGAHAWVRANQGYDAVGVFAWALGVGPRPSLHERADPALAAKLGFLVEERPAILESATLRSAAEMASLVEEVKAADARAWEALEKIPPAVLLDPRGSGAEREARANAKRSVMAPVRRRALRWLRGDTISYADSATGLFA